MSHIVAIGGGQAASALVAKLRAIGCKDKITLIGSEPEPPYQRPPLSKAYLLGQMDKERLYLRPPSYYSDNEVALKLGVPVASIDAQNRTLDCGGEEMAYDELVLCTGALPRQLPAKIGGNLSGVYCVRSLADVQEMAPAFEAGARVLIIGGGYIGLEAAAVAAKLGLSTTVIEMADRILQRVAAPETSDYFRQLHRAHGVEILENTGLVRLLGDTRVHGAEFSTGETRDFDFVIVGIGVAADTELAETAGVACDQGILVNAYGQTNLPHIWAAGDCARLPYRDEMIRLESVQNAIDQAEAVAGNIMGANSPYVPKPWFWSDQFDTKLQIAGLNTGYDQVVVRNTNGARSHWYYAGDTLLAVDAMNDPRAYMIGKRLIEAGKSPAARLVSDPELDLKSLLSR